MVVVHGQASDPFWSVVKNGVDEAQKDTGATVEYRAPATFDMVEMSQLIDAAVASKPDGLVVSVPDAAALGDFDQERRRLGHPRRVDELGLGRARGAGRAGPCRPDRVRGGRGRRQEDEGGRRHQGDLRQPGGRQRRARPALRGLRQGARRRRPGGRRQHGPDRDPERDQGPVCRQLGHRRRAGPRALGRRADARRAATSSTSWTR